MDMNMNNNPQMQVNVQKQEAEKPNSKIDENDSSKIDELAGTIYQIIEAKYPK